MRIKILILYIKADKCLKNEIMILRKQIVRELQFRSWDNQFPNYIFLGDNDPLINCSLKQYLIN
jgi:hypothetical protein